jgi:hypothetical protein
MIPVPSGVRIWLATGHNIGDGFQVCSRDQRLLRITGPRSTTFSFRRFGFEPSTAMAAASASVASLRSMHPFELKKLIVPRASIFRACPGPRQIKTSTTFCFEFAYCGSAVSPDSRPE